MLMSRWGPTVLFVWRNRHFVGIARIARKGPFVGAFVVALARLGGAVAIMLLWYGTIPTSR
eukprot:scaffold1992_cov187-Amphora_coffeaeformis.AAC.32